MSKVIHVIGECDHGELSIKDKAYTDGSKAKEHADERHTCTGSCCANMSIEGRTVITRFAEEVELTGDFNPDELIAQFKCDQCGALHTRPLFEVTTMHGMICDECHMVENYLELHKIIIA